MCDFDRAAQCDPAALERAQCARQASQVCASVCVRPAVRLSSAHGVVARVFSVSCIDACASGWWKRACACVVM
eukprot:6188189-Pleurochrysis_carterae.AAC.1